MNDLAGIHSFAKSGPSSATTGLVGVLGGMGPLATVDFLRKVVLATNARIDQEHIPLVISAIPQVPDRTAAFLGLGASPLPAMIESAKRLVCAGAELIVIPCNTAHLWFDEIQTAIGLPMIHLVDAAIDAAIQQSGAGAKIGLLATDATLSSGLYVNRHQNRPQALTLDDYGLNENISWVLPTRNEMERYVMPGIAAVKAGQLNQASELMRLALRGLHSRGASSVIMGCTEIPLALEKEATPLHLVDATASLAQQVVTWSLATRAATLTGNPSAPPQRLGSQA